MLDTMNTAHCDFIFCAIQILLLTYLLTYLIHKITSTAAIGDYRTTLCKVLYARLSFLSSVHTTSVHGPWTRAVDVARRDFGRP